jgi:hypothetical protein
LFANEVVEQEGQSEDGFVLTVRWSGDQKAQYDAL